jgi:hypothetical protein
MYKGEKTFANILLFLCVLDHSEMNVFPGDLTKQAHLRHLACDLLLCMTFI